MKKINILIILGLLCTNVFAQITLKDDSTTFKSEIPKSGKLNSEQFKKLNGFSKYSGTIQGFSGYCNYSSDDQKLFYSNFHNQILNLNLSTEENEILFNSFKQSAYEIKEKGINGVSCDKFKDDFSKIISDIRK